MLKRLINYLLIGTLLGFTSMADSIKDAVDFTQGVMEQLLTVSKQNISPQDKVKQYQPIIQQHIALERVARFVIGKDLFNSLDKPKQEQLYETLSLAIAKGIVQNTNQYKGTGFKVISTDLNGTNFFIAVAIEHNASKLPVMINLRCIRNESNQYKITDIMIEGISQSIGLKNDFTGILNQNNHNIDELIRIIHQP